MKKKSADAPRYRKLFPMFWRDRRVRALVAEEKLVAAYCLTSHQTNRIGLFSFSASLAAEDLDTSPATFAKRFEKVCETLGWKFDVDARCLYIPTWWKWNQPEGANVMKGCLRDFTEVPESSLTREFIENETYLSGTLLETFRERFAKVLETLPNSGKQEQEQDVVATNTSKNGTLPKRFIKPTPSEVLAYATEAGLTIDAQHFVDHYESKGWKVGKVAMKDWQAAIRNWCRSEFGPKQPGSRVPTAEDDANWSPYGGND